jgi:hypothetical protein
MTTSDGTDRPEPVPGPVPEGGDPGTGEGRALTVPGATPEQQGLIDLAVAYWHRTTPGDALLGAELLPDDDAVVVSRLARGGGRIYVAADGSALFVGSAVPPHEATEAFRSGRRTPSDRFRPAGTASPAGPAGAR